MPGCGIGVLADWDGQKISQIFNWKTKTTYRLIQEKVTLVFRPKNVKGEALRDPT
jgi:hypothetical protein